MRKISRIRQAVALMSLNLILALLSMLAFWTSGIRLNFGGHEKLVVGALGTAAFLTFAWLVLDGYLYMHNSFRLNKRKWDMTKEFENYSAGVPTDVVRYARYNGSKILSEALERLRESRLGNFSLKDKLEFKCNLEDRHLELVELSMQRMREYEAQLSRKYAEEAALEVERETQRRAARALLRGSQRKPSGPQLTTREAGKQPVALPPLNRGVVPALQNLLSRSAGELTPDQYANFREMIDELEGLVPESRAFRKKAYEIEHGIPETIQANKEGLEKQTGISA